MQVSLLRSGLRGTLRAGRVVDALKKVLTRIYIA